MKIVLYTIILISFCFSASAQNRHSKRARQQNMMETHQHSYSKARAIIKDSQNKEISFVGWRIDGGTFHFDMMDGNKPKKMPLENIVRLEQIVGTHFWTGFWWGFTPIVLFSIDDLNIHGEYVFAKGILISLVSGGAGALIGYFFDDWEEVYLGQYKSKDVSFNFTPTFLPMTKNIGLNLSVSF
jgi:hypothetical protein